MPKAYIIHDSGYHIEDISPVPTGTDIIVKTAFVRQKRFLQGTPEGTRCNFALQNCIVSPPSRPAASGMPPAYRIGLFESLLARSARQIRGIPQRVSLLFVWYTRRDSNPQPSEPESDALSIEPLVHSLVIITKQFLFVKGKTKES